MTEAMYYILLALLRPGHGYGMMQRIKELSGGRLEMGPGTLYGVLSRMNREGWIVLTGEEGRRKNYAITQAGKAALLTEYERIKRLAADGRLLEEAGK
ncbi:MAG: helix-turn-helix transcriptional regulator [Oscillospiraceae bacterium]|nr:helix-turn-helix transcriptional regulator [Oscillospiraceae bacterium]